MAQEDAVPEHGSSAEVDVVEDSLMTNGMDAEEIVSTSPIVTTTKAVAPSNVTIDPIYEAKARVLNNAVCLFSTSRDAIADFSRSRRSAWDGINGSSLALLDLAGLMTICGPSLHR
jgi:hypothetical protein